MTTISRRAFLAGAASLPTLPRASSASDADVAIVGAGAAGLAAATRLRREGRSFVVLEARPRIGGRVFTDASLGAPFDAGAQYIHWGERNPWREIAEGFGTRLQEEEPGGSLRVYRDGAVLPAAERARRSSGFGQVWSAIEASAPHDRSFADAVREAPPEVLAAAAGITLFSLGEDPERVSIEDYQQLWSGDDYVMPEGYGTLVARYGADVPVRLGTPVTRIAWDGPGVALETAAGTLRARAAIVTVPVGVLQAGGIRFAPELPSATLQALDGLGMGALTKIALGIDRARLGPVPATDLIEIGDSGALTSYDLFHFGRDLTLVTLGGDHARRICELGERGAVGFAIERLAAMAGGQARAAVKGGRLAGWWTDPFSRGSYSIAKPGQATARERLRVPVAERIWLAGEATAGGGAMTAGGAFLEGERAAAAVIEALGER